MNFLDRHSIGLAKLQGYRDRKETLKLKANTLQTGSHKVAINSSHHFVTYTNHAVNTQFTPKQKLVSTLTFLLGI